MKWTDIFKRAKPKGLDINQPIPVSSPKVSLPEPDKESPVWKRLNLKPRRMSAVDKAKRA